MHLMSKLLTPGWCVAWRIKSTNNDIFSEKEPFFVIPNPQDAWVADPFLFEYNNEPYIFGELYDLSEGKGSIAYCRPLQNDCQWIKIIDEPYHMSYPFIFKRDSDIFIMPETSQNRTIQLYKAISFPDVWEKQSPLRENVDYVDVTPFLQESPQKALAYRVDAQKIENSELWMIDLCNHCADYKIQTFDAELRRPAGAIDENKMIRIGQNSTFDYGDGLVFYRYDELNGSEYCEHEVKRIGFEQLHFSSKMKCTGLHTYNQSEHYECIDVRTKTLMIKNMFRKIVSKLRF